MRIRAIGRAIGGALGLLLLIAGSAAAQASPENARVPPLASVTDATGAVWTLAPGTGTRAVLKDGSRVPGVGSALLLWQGTVWTRDTAGAWWQRTGAGAAGGWTRVGADPSLAPPVVAPGGTRLTWAEAEPLARATVGIYTLYVDGVGQALARAGVVCVAAGAASTCEAPLPALTPGPHSLAISYTIGTDESPRTPTIPVTTVTTVTPTAFALQ